jgi:hypothetical protein
VRAVRAAADPRSTATVRSAPVVISAAEVRSEWATLYFDTNGRRVDRPAAGGVAAASVHASSDLRSEAAAAAAEVAAAAAACRFECQQLWAEPAGAGRCAVGSERAGEGELRITAADGSRVSPLKQRTLGLKGGGTAASHLHLYAHNSGLHGCDVHRQGSWMRGAQARLPPRRRHQRCCLRCATCSTCMFHARFGLTCSTCMFHARFGLNIDMRWIYETMTLT